MPVQVEQEQLEPCRVALTIAVPPEDIQKAIDQVYGQFAKRTNVPGFRPGKAPAHLVKKFIDESRVRELAMDQILNNAYRDALRQSGVDPYRYAEPAVEMPEEELDLEQGFSFKATVALSPHVHLGNLEGLSARRVVTVIRDEDVDKELERIRETAAYYDQTDEGAEDTDRVRTSVNVTMDGEPVEDASFPEPTLIQVGSNLPALDEGLRGVKAGEEKTFEFTYPEDFQDEARQGKTAVCTVNVTEVWRRRVPEATDEFAKQAGFESLEALRDRVRTALQQQADALADSEVNDALVEELVKRSHIHYPEEMIEQQVSSRMSDLIKNLERRSFTLDDFLANEKKDLATLQAEMREQALEGVTNALVLVDFAREHEITVSEKEIEAEIKRRAEAEKVKVSQMRRVLTESGETDVIRHRIRYAKVADVLRQHAEIREVEA